MKRHVLLYLGSVACVRVLVLIVVFYRFVVKCLLLSLSLSISESVIITRFSRVSVLLYVAFDDLLTP